MHTLVIYLLFTYVFHPLTISNPQTKLNRTRQWADSSKVPFLPYLSGLGIEHVSANSRYSINAD